jgi:hypothetical protein
LSSSDASAIAEGVLAGSVLVTAIVWLVRQVASSIREASYRAAKDSHRDTSEGLLKTTTAIDVRYAKFAQEAERNRNITLAVVLAAMTYIILDKLIRRGGADMQDKRARENRSRAVSSMVERRTFNPYDEGSTPLRPTRASLAQLDSAVAF